MNIVNWLEANESRVLKRLAELIAVNRGRMVIEGQIGQSVPTDQNRYGRFGLKVQEAFELTYLRGMFDAFATGESEAVMLNVKGMIERECMGMVIAIPDAALKAKLLAPVAMPQKGSVARGK